MISPDTRCRRSESIVHRKIGSEAVLVPIRGDLGDLQCIYTLNEVGQRVWELMDGARSVAQISAQIAAEFEVDEVTARKDVIEFLRELIELKAAEIA